VSYRTLKRSGVLLWGNFQNDALVTTICGVSVALACALGPRATKAYSVPPPPHYWNILAFSPDGSVLAAATGDSIKLWDAKSGELRSVFPTQGDSGYHSVAFSPDGTAVVGAATTCICNEGDARIIGKILMWDVGTGDLRRTLSTEGDNTSSLAISQDGKLLAAGGGSAIRLWDFHTGRAVRTLKTPGSATSVAFSPDAGYMAAACYPNCLALWETASGKALRTIRAHASSCESVAFSPDGKMIASGGFGEEPKTRASMGDLALWEVPTVKLLRRIKQVTAPRPAVFSPDGKAVAVAGFGIFLWGVETGKSLGSITGEQKVSYGFAFSPDGQTVAVGRWHDDEKVIWRFGVELWDLRSGSLIRELQQSPE